MAGFGLLPNARVELKRIGCAKSHKCNGIFGISILDIPGTSTGVLDVESPAKHTKSGVISKELKIE